MIEQKVLTIRGTKMEMALMIAEIHAMRKLFAIMFAFLFWFFLSIFLAILCLAKIIRLEQFLSVRQYLSILGISPFLLTISSYRLVEKWLDEYVRRFLKSHVQINEET
jgi:hypothetical protein